jgi:hypothetical protein
MRKLVSIAVATLLISSLACAGDVYRWKDDNGTWHYSDQPQPGAELVRATRKSFGAAAQAAPPASTPAAAAPNAPPGVTPEVAKQVRQEAATAKVDQCKKATDAYQKAVQARRIYKDDGKGNRTFLNDSQIDAARLEARSNRDVACGP